MKIKKKNIFSKLGYTFIILLVTIIFLFRLFYESRLFGHDTAFHTFNIIQLSKTISITNILGNNIIQANLCKFGYGTWLFYPKLPHLIAAYLYKIFNNIYISMNIVYFITTFISGILVYFLSNKMFKNKKIALISSIIYITTTYHMCEIYIRDAFAENFMFLVIPLIFLGLYNLKDNEYKKFYINFTLGYIIGIYSHLISMVFCTILVALFLIYYRKYFLKKDKIKALIISTLIVIGITLPFLTLLVEYKHLNIYTVYLSDNFSNRISTILSLLSLKNYYSTEYINNNLKFFFTYPIIILFIITSIKIFMNKKNKYFINHKFLLISIIALITMMSSSIIWENIPEIFVMIQFPWRLMTFLSLAVSLYAPLCLENIQNSNNTNKLILKMSYVLLLALIIIKGVSNIDYYGDSQYSENQINELPESIGWQNEYLPLSTNEDYVSIFNLYYQQRDYDILSIDNNVEIKIIEDNFPDITFKVSSLNSAAEIELPRIYYLGYSLKNEYGNKIKLNNDKHGFLSATITKEGTYYLEYTTTFLEKISKIIRIVTIIFIIYISVRRCKYEKK